MFHLRGNSYVWYGDLAKKAIDSRYYAGKKIHTVVPRGVNFSRSICKAEDGGKQCQGEYHNFTHEMKVSPEIYRVLFPPELRAEPNRQHRE
jgi:hypothetical protein